jgi:hypothetical protein
MFMPWLRKILFYLFVVIFLISCPLLILYALGITFKPETQEVQRTGIIYLSTIPSAAAVYINNKQFSETTPTIIRNLPQGSYRVKVLRQGYHPWTKKLPVQKTKATVAEKILLIPLEWKTRELSPDPFQELEAFSGHPFFLLKKGPLLKDVVLFRWHDNLNGNTGGSLKTQALSPLLPEQHPLAAAKLLKLRIMPEGSVALLEIKLKGDIKFLYLNLKPAAASPQDISSLFPKPPDQILWDPDSEKILYAFQENFINQIDVPSQTISPHIVENVRSFAVRGSRIYALSRDYRVRRYDEKGKNPQPLLKDPELGTSLFEKYKQLQLSVLSNRIIVFLSNTGALLCNQLPYELEPEGVKGMKFDKAHKRLLVWKQDAVGYVDFAQDSAEGIFEEGPKLTWLNIPAKNIHDAFWANDGTQVLYVDEGTVFITETESFGEQAAHPVTEIKRGSSIHYSDDIGQIFFLEHKTGRLRTTEIIPKGSVFPLPAFDQTEQTKQDDIP